MSKGMLADALHANPGLGSSPAPRPSPTASISTVRAQAPGGELLTYLQSEQLLYFEQMYRVLPPKGMYQASAQKPVTFTMGSFRVPQNQVLVVMDYAFDIYGFSGQAAGDYVPLQPNRLPTQVMWDIKVNNNRPGQVKYQIVPQQQTQSAPAFSIASVMAPAQQFEFDQVRAAQLQGTASPALAGMPQRRYRPGLIKVANQYVARASTTLEVTCSIIGSVPIPLAFFEANVMGTLFSQNVYDAYQSANVPTGNPHVPVVIDQTSDRRP